MDIRKRTLKIMAETVTGDNSYSFRRSGPDLVEFFNELGFNDTYGQGFPTRWVYAEDKIKEMVEQDRLIDFINYSLSEEHYFETQSVKYEAQDQIIEFWNKYLELDGLEIIRNGDRFLLNDLTTSKVIIKEEQLDIISTEFLRQQIDKCEKKLSSSDFDGAITNARALVEEVLLEIEERLTGQRGKNGGDMAVLYNRIKKLINFDPGQEGLNESLKQILQGLNSIVLGVSKLRTKASDSHSREFKPNEHHARLAVNSAMTFTSFVIESYFYQQNKKALVDK